MLAAAERERAGAGVGGALRDPGRRGALAGARAGAADRDRHRVLALTLYVTRAGRLVRTTPVTRSERTVDGAGVGDGVITGGAGVGAGGAGGTGVGFGGTAVGVGA